VSRRGRAHNIADLRRAARRALPRPVFEFIDGGAEDEVTLARNRDDLRAIALVPRVLRAVGGADTSTTVLGQRVALPVLAAPTGLSTFAHPAGEVGVARGVHGAGSLYMLSGAAACTPEAVAAAATGARPWFQLYLWRDRGLVRDVLARVHEAGFAALALTVDVPVSGRRERDVRNGFTIPPRLGARTIAQGLARPRWSAGFLRAGGLSTGGGVVRGAVAFAARVNAQMDPRLTWETLDWLRGEWERPLLVKGVLHAGDAARATATSCAGRFYARRVPDAPRQPAATGSSSPTTAGASSTGRSPRSPPCLRSPTRSARMRRCISTAACAAAATWPRRLRSARGRAWSGAPCCTASPPAARPACAARSACCATSLRRAWPCWAARRRAS
jgi:isopentenyl diphosphate isomerase/L-lactate dehydrogenase-like FMN-dependent dehydrogenase